MNHSLIAIDVGAGDAFFLRRAKFTALVDGGLAQGFPNRLKRAAQVDSVNVLVCTHNDADHANGVLEFLREGGHADECWLPATWVEAIGSLCEASLNEFELLLKNTDGNPTDDPRETDEVGIDMVLGKLDQLLDGPVPPEPSLAAHILHDGWTFGSVVAIGEFFRLLGGAQSILQYGHASSGIPPLLKSAKRILEIAAIARQQQISIRWFDHRVPATQMGDCPLSVISAAEVHSIPRRKLPINDAIELTMVNRNSLVLFTEGDATAPAVLFCADSGFATIGIPPTERGMIVTAPHHGSADRENIKVYSKLDQAGADNQPDSSPWVRSDRDVVSRPCDAFMSRRRRYCTRCRGQSTHQPHQTVRFEGDSGDWSTRARPCNCAPTKAQSNLATNSGKAAATKSAPQ